jgi:transcriptional regulator with XRE-family HTH domain
VDEKEFKKQVGKNLKTLRKQRGLTQGELCKLVGLKSKGNTISDIECGKSLVSMSKLPQFLKVLRCSPQELLSPLFEEKETELERLCTRIKEIFTTEQMRDMIRIMVECLERIKISMDSYFPRAEK